MADLLPGYRIRKQIGVGARSRIYLAIESATGEPYAVKHVVRESSDDDRFVRQTETEFAVSSKVNHRNLRRGHHLQRIRRRLQLRDLLVVLEWVDGLTLENARPNRLSTFLKIFQKTAVGLGALHEAGYVHADIKPGNIMLGRRGLLKVIDFGQACPLGHRKERIQGTPDYIAPEQVLRLALDQRTDIFNLGATMYWVLTSENYPTAIRGTQTRGGINLVPSDQPIAPIELNDKIPLSLSNLVMECCRENPQERPADMSQLLARLAAVEKVWGKQREAFRLQRLRGADSRAMGESERSGDHHA